MRAHRVQSTASQRVSRYRRVVAKIAVYVETGTKRVFASAVEWPGWARSGRTEDDALQALVDYAPRYAKAVSPSRPGFIAPTRVADLTVIERIGGDATTDFGAPGAKPKLDETKTSPADLRRLEALIEAAWRTLDGAAAKARGKTLTKGPRGGGRSLAAILQHVHDAEGGYLSALGWKAPPEARRDTKSMRAAVLEGIAASARGEIAEKGPRGGVRWKPRFFARRLAWHALDHAWEIEDRARSAATRARTR